MKKDWDIHGAKRILVIGPIAAGKTTFSLALAKKTGLPLHFLDKLYWNPNWVASSPEEFEAKQQEVVEQPEWIFEGTNVWTLDLRLPHADAVIFIDRPWWECHWRLIRRTIVYRKRQRVDMSDYCYDDFDRSFLHMMKYIWNFDRDIRPQIEEKLAGLRDDQRLIRLRYPEEAEKFLDSLF